MARFAAGASALLGTTAAGLILVTGCGLGTTQRPPAVGAASPEAVVAPSPPPPPSPAVSPTASPTPPPAAGSTPPAASPPPPTPPPPAATPLPAGTFQATVVAAAGADVRSGPGSDMAVVGHHPAGTVDLYNGWYARGDDPPVPDATSGALESWSQDWLRLATGEGWIHSAYVKGGQPAGMAPVAWTAPQVRNVPIPTAGQRRIIVSITRQHLWAFDGSTLFLDSQVATGRPALPTLLGTYHVFDKRSPYEFVSPWPLGSPFWYASAWSNYAMEFITGGYFIHDAPWRSRWGPGANLAAGSHGCVNVLGGPMVRLYGWTRVGEEVVVQQQ